MAAAKAASMSGHLVSFHKPGTFVEHRLALPAASDPTGQGMLSLGLSGGKIHVYWTKFVGMEGCIDWDLQALLNKVRSCIESQSITDDMAALIQGVSNQLMPGLQWDVSGAGVLNTHVFLRPHTEGRRAGFVISLNRDFSLTDIIPGSSGLIENLASAAPVYSLMNRSIGESTPVGDVKASLLLIFKAAGSVSVMLDIIFLFNSSFSGQASEIVSRGFVNKSNCSSFSSSSKSNKGKSVSEEDSKTSGDGSEEDSVSSIGSVDMGATGFGSNGLVFPSLPLATAAGILGLLGLSKVAFPGAVSRM